MTIKQLRNTLLVVILFCCVVAVNFNKPFGFFRESSPAIVCINTNIWQNNTSIKNTYIPVNSYAFLNYSNIKDKLYNSTITFGNGWFIVPYYFFTITHITPNEIGIRIFSVTWLIFTLICLGFLTKTFITYYKLQKHFLSLVLILYSFSPGTLWYHVNGYVHEIAVLPFYFFAWYTFIQFISTRTKKWLYLLSFSLMLGVLFDWLPIFQAFIISLYLFFHSYKLKLKWFEVLLPLIAVILSTIFVIYLYANWCGLGLYANYMWGKFTGRAYGGSKLELHRLIPSGFNLFIFYLLSFGVLYILAFQQLVQQLQQYKMLILLIVTALLHHFVFWGFSNEHDHAAMKMLLPILIIFVLSFENKLLKTQPSLLLFAIIAFNILQYFFIHNYLVYKRNSTDEAYFKKVASIIAFYKEKNTIVCCNTNKYYPQVEFYAQNFYVLANSVTQAKQELKRKKITHTAIFIELENANVKSTTPLQ